MYEHNTLIDLNKYIRPFSFNMSLLEALDIQKSCTFKIEHTGRISDFHKYSNEALQKKGIKITKLCLLHNHTTENEFTYYEYPNIDAQSLINMLNSYDFILTHNLKHQLRLVEYLAYQEDLADYEISDTQYKYCLMELGRKLTNRHVYRNGKKVKKYPSLVELQETFTSNFEPIENSLDFLLVAQECLYPLLLAQESQVTENKDLATA